MDLTSPAIIKEILIKRGFWPQKRFGQNFIVDQGVLEKVAAAADLSPKDAVLKIGPGLGALTKELTKKAKKVIAIEKDRNMVEILKETLKDFKNVEIINDDIRISDFPKSILRISDIHKYKIVANLPFYLTAPVIRQFLEFVEDHPQPKSLTLVVQKEVGQRICSKPPRMSILANSVQFYADAEIVSYISKNSFWPRPKVDAAIIKIRSTKSEIRNNVDKDLFFRVMKAGFSHPRKQLLNNLSNGLKMDRKRVKNWLLKNNIRPTQRAETLSVGDWVHLTETFVL